MKLFIVSSLRTIRAAYKAPLAYCMILSLALVENRPLQAIASLLAMGMKAWWVGIS